MQGTSPSYPTYAGSQPPAGMSPAYYAGPQPSAAPGAAYSSMAGPQPSAVPGAAYSSMAGLRAQNAAAQQAYASYSVPPPAGAAFQPGQSSPAQDSASAFAPAPGAASSSSQPWQDMGAASPPVPHAHATGPAPGASSRNPIAGGGIPYDTAMPQVDIPGAYPAQQQQQSMGPPTAWGGRVPPEPVRTRVHVRLPQPRFHGAPQFYGCVPRDGATFAWPELCVTPDNEFAGMAPAPGVQKSWYNTVLYHPEERSHVENQFLERFVQGPNGEWIDVVKARRMAKFFEEKREQEMHDQMERQMLVSGSAMEKTGYTDAYSGEPLVACRGELASKEAILEEHGIHRSATELAKVMMQDTRSMSDWDNLRIYWPFATASRNKMVSQHTYDWFDRNSNPYVPADDCVEIFELNSMYVDKEHYEKDLAGQIMQRRQQIQEAYQAAGAKFVQM